MILGLFPSERTDPVRAAHRLPIGRRTRSDPESVRLVRQELIAAEVSTLIGAERYERTNERNGHCSPELTTKAGGVDLAAVAMMTVRRPESSCPPSDRHRE